MSKRIDLTGKTFNDLTVLCYSYTNGHAYWKCKCKCGNEFTANSGDIKRMKSCGGCSRIKHGFCGKSIYITWKNMLQRCKNIKNDEYKNYGERGITVCDKWLNFEGFYEDMGDKPDGLSLDRIDVNGNYCKDNCRWATNKEQANNKRNNNIITFIGKTQTITEWSKEFNINLRTLRDRIYVRNWSIEKALTTSTLK